MKNVTITDARGLRLVSMEATYDDESHPDQCCESCIQDIEAGYGGDILPNCCCKAIAQRRGWS